jgi:hypothetical protein
MGSSLTRTTIDWVAPALGFSLLCRGRRALHGRLPGRLLGVRAARNYDGRTTRERDRRREGDPDGVQRLYYGLARKLHRGAFRKWPLATGSELRPLAASSRRKLNGGYRHEPWRPRGA